MEGQETPSNIAVRRATPRDYPAVMKIGYEDIGDFDYLTWFFWFALHNNHCVSFVATLDGKIVSDPSLIYWFPSNTTRCSFLQFLTHWYNNVLCMLSYGYRKVTFPSKSNSTNLENKNNLGKTKPMCKSSRLTAQIWLKCSRRVICQLTVRKCIRKLKQVSKMIRYASRLVWCWISL